MRPTEGRHRCDRCRCVCALVTVSEVIVMLVCLRMFPEHLTQLALKEWISQVIAVTGETLFNTSGSGTPSTPPPLHPPLPFLCNVAQRVQCRCFALSKAAFQVKRQERCPAFATGNQRRVSPARRRTSAGLTKQSCRSLEANCALAYLPDHLGFPHL